MRNLLAVVGVVGVILFWPATASAQGCYGGPAGYANGGGGSPYAYGNGGGFAAPSAYSPPGRLFEIRGGIDLVPRYPFFGPGGYAAPPAPYGYESERRYFRNGGPRYESFRSVPYGNGGGRMICGPGGCYYVR